MKSVAPAPKRLIICCDGTSQSSVSGKRNIPSNVARLARTIARAGEDATGKWQQLVYYDAGIGTGSLSTIEAMRQSGTGDGLVINVLEAYNFLVNNYAEGDQIFCIGFSRGAFTARAVAGLVTDIGIFKPSNMQHFPPLWSAYQKNVAKRDFRKTKEWFQFINGMRPMVPQGEENKPYTRKAWEAPHRDSIEPDKEPTWPNSNVVEVVAVYDTVGSLGMADTRVHGHADTRVKFEYLNVKLSPFINHAFHALALDEHREPFLPTLWYIPNEKTLKAEDAVIAKDCEGWPELKAYRDKIDAQIKEYAAKHPPDLYQVWFPGVHINIGGGADEDSADAEGLSNLTFAWMVQQLGPYLAFEPWTWGPDGIAGYQKRVLLEEKMYQSMKTEMTADEQKEYSGLIQKSQYETVKDTASDWAHWAAKGVKSTIVTPTQVKLVPVRAEKISDPPPILKGEKDITARWGVSVYKDSYSTFYQVMSAAVNRAPGEAHDRSREGGGPLQALGDTNEYIHPSVWWRYQTMKDAKGEPQYVSQALLGFKRTQDNKYGSWGYWKKDVGVWIPEWFMKPSDKYLRAKGFGEFAGNGDDDWQHAEWTYTDNVESSSDLHTKLISFYVDAQHAKKKMEAAGQVFPFKVTDVVVGM